MPLKHSTETAYLVLLGLVICTAGFAVSLLPDLPSGLLYWLVACALCALYPLVLSHTFRKNRADYEFRLLHWFPLGIFALWGALQYLAPHSYWMNVLKLGFLFLWSLPIVALGLSLIMIFAVHVMRKSRGRVMILSVFLVLFTIGAVLAEGKGWNARLQKNLFPPHAPVVASLRSAISLASYLMQRPKQSDIVAMVDSSSIASVMNPVLPAEPVVMVAMKPHRLPKSGSESFLIFFATLLSLYAGMLHARSSARVQEKV